MPTLSDSVEDLNWVRGYVGDEPDDNTLDDIFDTPGIGTREAVATWVLKNRLANALNGPSEFSIPGQYSESKRDQIKGLQTALDGIAGLGDEAPDEGDLTVVTASPRPACR